MVRWVKSLLLLLSSPISWSWRYTVSLQRPCSSCWVMIQSCQLIQTESHKTPMEYPLIHSLTPLRLTSNTTSTTQLQAWVTLLKPDISTVLTKPHPNTFAMVKITTMRCLVSSLTGCLQSTLQSIWELSTSVASTRTEFGHSSNSFQQCLKSWAPTVHTLETQSLIQLKPCTMLNLDISSLSSWSNGLTFLHANREKSLWFILDSINTCSEVFWPKLYFSSSCSMCLEWTQFLEEDHWTSSS